MNEQEFYTDYSVLYVEVSKELCSILFAPPSPPCPDTFLEVDIRRRRGLEIAQLEVWALRGALVSSFMATTNLHNVEGAAGKY